MHVRKRIVMASLGVAFGVSLLGAIAWIWTSSRTGPDGVAAPPAASSARATAASPVELERPASSSSDVLVRPESAGESRAPASATSSHLRVRLVDATGRTVDHHPLRARAAAGHTDLDDGRYLYEETDSRGLVTFPRPELEELSTRADFLLRVELGTRHPESPALELRLSEVTAEPIELRADLGRLVISAREPGGETWTGRHGALVRPEDFHYHSNAGDTPVVLWVPIGVPYRVKVYGCGLYREVEEDFPPLPASEGERAHVLQLAGSYPALRGIAVDEAGLPLPPRTVLRFRDHDRSGQGSRLTFVRDAGEFVEPLDLGESAGETRTFEITMDLDRMLHAYAADVTFEVPLDGETVDVGTIVLAPQPVLAAGRVLPPEGYRADGIPVEVTVRESSGRWRRHPELDNCAFTDDDGTFTVFGSDVGGPYRVEVSTSFRSDLDGAVTTQEYEIEFGATDLVIPLVWSGGVEVEVDESDDRLPRSFEIVLHHVPEGSETEVEHVLRVGRGWGYREFSELLPGRARVELRSHTGVVLAERDGLRIEPRRTTDAGTLAPDPTLAWIRVTLPEGVGKTQLLHGPAGSGTFDTEWSLRSDEHDVPVRSFPIDLLVRAPGYRQELLRDVTGDVTVGLREAPLVELRFTGTSQLAAWAAEAGDEEGYLICELEPVGIRTDLDVRSGPPRPVEPMTLGPTDPDPVTVLAPLDEPGRYAVWFRLGFSSDEDRESPPTRAGEIVVGESGGTFDLRIPHLEFPR